MASPVRLSSFTPLRAKKGTLRPYQLLDYRHRHGIEQGTIASTHDNDEGRNIPAILAVRFGALPYQRQIHHLIPNFRDRGIRFTGRVHRALPLRRRKTN